VTNTAALLDSLSPVLGPAERTPDGLGKIGRGVATGYVREQGGWAFLAQGADTLQRLPDPQAMLGSLPQTYDGAVRLYPRRIPEALRTMAIDQIRTQNGNGTLPGAAGQDRAVALQLRLVERNLAALEAFLAHGEHATLGWAIDRTTRKATLELFVSPAAGTPWAARTAAWKPTRTEFGNVGAKEGALVMRAGGPLTLEQIGRMSDDLNAWSGAIAHWVENSAAINSDRKRQFLTTLTGVVLEICQAAASTGRLDLAFALQGENSLTLLAAAHIGNAQGAERITARLNTVAKNAPLCRVKLDAAKLASARVHSVEFVGLGDDPTFRSLLGPDATLYVALAEERAFLAMGPGALAAVEASLPRVCSAPPHWG
jgi:hypothetical protein